MKRVKLPLLLGIGTMVAAGAACAQTTPLAVSERLGIQVLPPVGRSWCSTRPTLRVLAKDASTFQDPSLLSALQRVGASLVSGQCSQAQAVDFVGGAQDGSTVDWSARATRSELWAVRPTSGGQPKAASPPPGSDGAVNLDDPPAPEPSVPPAASAPDKPGPAAAATVVAKPTANDTAVSLLGQSVRIVLKAGLDHAVVINGREVARGSADRPATIADARTIGGTGYVLVAQPNSGNACPGGSYYLVVMRPSGVSRTKEFGTCSEAGPTLTTVAGNWTADMPGPLAEKQTTYTVSDGKLSSVERSVPTRGSGPEVGDVRPLLKGSAGDFVKLTLADEAVHRILPPADYKAFRELALNGPQGNWKRTGDFVVGWGCRAHSCNGENFALGFGPANQAVLRWTRGGSTRFFGNPPAPLRAILERAD